MARNKVQISELAGVIDETLVMYSADIRKGIEEEAEVAMKKLLKATRRDAPERTGDYKKAISSSTDKNTIGTYSKVWYVKAPHYRLTHLLNNGHATRNGGRVEGDGHITNNEKIVVEEFEEKVKGVIENGGR